MFVFVISTNAETKSDTDNQYSRDYDDLNQLKDIPNFWDLFSDYPQSDYPQFTSTDEYPRQYALPPTKQGY